MGEKESDLILALREFKEKMHQKYGVSTMILFGSQVTGGGDEDSDVDLIVVSDEFVDKSPLKRPLNLYLEWTMDYPVDFLCYTPEEFEERRKEIRIVSQAVKEGVATSLEASLPDVSQNYVLQDLMNRVVVVWAILIPKLPYGYQSPARLCLPNSITLH